MNTLRVCATVGLGLSLVLGAGCKSDSKSGGTDGSTRDTRRTDAPQNNQNPDTTSAGPCTIQGNTVQPGRTIVINCITWTCQGDNNVTGNGTACADAGPTPDVAPVNRDTAAPVDTRPVDSGPAIDGAGGKDTQPAEAGTVKLDGGNKDTVVADVFVPLDTAPPEPDLAVVDDTAPPEPDLPVVADTSPPVITCTSESGQKYYAGGGVCFPCASNLCVCDANGVITQSASCSPIDAQ